ncbi:MAG TPA: DinB family protein [Salinimicrobium sp.]|nr:DinB family protein [Salinimicrobium sp.]
MRKQLAKHLKGGEAFEPIEKILEEIPFDKLGIRPYELPYSFYGLFYHIAFAQKDILDFIVSDSYKTPNWPADYWPNEQSPENEAAWKDLKTSYFEDRQQLADWLLNEENKLTDPVKNGDEQSLFREVLLVLEHTAYHTGQLVVILRLLKLHWD